METLIIFIPPTPDAVGEGPAPTPTVTYDGVQVATGFDGNEILSHVYRFLNENALDYNRMAPRYSVGDHVWMMNQNRPTRFRVEKEVATRTYSPRSTSRVEYHYLLAQEYGQGQWNPEQQPVEERRLYPTKEALVASL